MSNRHVKELSKVWKCIIRDAAQAYPELTAELERDTLRCERLLEARGIRVFLVDLPAVGKHLDRCLSDGEYSLPSLPLTKRRNGRVLTPKFLGGLHLLIFDEVGRLREDADIQAIFFFRQLTLFAKKFVIDCPEHTVLSAVEELYVCDQSLPEPSRFWSDASIPVSESGFGGFSQRSFDLADQGERVDPLLLTNLDMVSRLVSRSLGPYRPSEWRFKHGPGAVSERQGKFDKYKWSNWSETLEKTYPIAEFGYHSHSSWARGVSTGRISGHCPVSRLVAVPKSFAGPRLIAAEPSEHMWCQQNLLSYMCNRVSKTILGEFVKFNDQTQNQDLCVQGSITGALSTIDLSMASDCVTPDFVGNFLRHRPDVLEALRATRTRILSQQLNRKLSERLELKKFSTMGNAYTFPIESLVFLSIAIAAVLSHRRQHATFESIQDLIGQVSVFGDDIIVPEDSRATVVRALEVFHFKVNVQKSFWNGNFRESCGVDAYKGHNVTPVYYRQPYDGSPRSLSSVVDVSNRYYQRYLLNTSAYLESTLPKQIAQVAMTSGAFGFKTRGELKNDPLRVCFNKHLHKFEILSRVVHSTTVKVETDGDSALHQYFTEAPQPTTMWAHGYVQRTYEKSRMSWVGLDEVVTQATSSGSVPSLE